MTKGGVCAKGKCPVCGGSYTLQIVSGKGWQDSGLFCETGGAMHPTPRHYYIDGRGLKKKSNKKKKVGRRSIDQQGRSLTDYHQSASYYGTIISDYNANYHNDKFDPEKYTSVGAKAYTVRECARAWQIHLEDLVAQKKKSKGHAIKMEIFFRLHVNPCIGDMNIRAIEATDIEALQKHLMGKNLSQRTIVAVLTALKTLFNRLQVRGLDIDGDKIHMDAIPLFPEEWSRIEKTKKNYITDEEQEYLLGRMDGWLKLWARIFFETGCRMGEVCAIHRSDVLPDRSIYIQRSIDFVTSEEKGTKTDEQRTVRISEDLYQSIIVLPVAGDVRLFNRPNGGAYNSGAISAMLREIYDAAGFTTLTPNASGRHSMATKMKQEAEGYEAASKQLGNSAQVARANYVQDESTRLRVPDVRRIKEG